MPHAEAAFGRAGGWAWNTGILSSETATTTADMVVLAAALAFAGLVDPEANADHKPYQDQAFQRTPSESVIQTCQCRPWLFRGAISRLGARRRAGITEKVVITGVARFPLERDGG